VAEQSCSQLLPVLIPAISGLLGTALGGLITYKVQKNIETIKTEQQKKALTAAFYGEIYSILQLTKTRQYFEMIYKILENINANDYYPPHEHFLTVNIKGYFEVYYNNTEHIGELDPDISPLITNFYVNIFSLLEDMTTEPADAFRLAIFVSNDYETRKNTYTDNLRRNLTNDLLILYKTIELGENICKNLSIRYGYKHRPVFDNLDYLRKMMSKFADIEKNYMGSDLHN